MKKNSLKIGRFMDSQYKNWMLNSSIAMQINI